MAVRPRAAFRRAAILLASGLAGGAVLAVLPGQDAKAYYLECCPFANSRVSHLIMSEAQSGGVDNSSWFQGAIANGISAWNTTPTPISITAQFSRSNQDIIWDVTQQTSDTQRSNGACTNYSGGICHQATIHLYEWCDSNGVCGMQSNTPNYDEYLVAHETGHALGEDHSCTYNVLMSGIPVNQGSGFTCPHGNPPYSYRSEDDFVGQPQQDDINGMQKMYGSDSYQYNSGGGCSDVKPVTLPTPSPPVQPALGIDSIVPESPPTPLLVQSVLQEGQDAASNPSGTAQNQANDGLAATGKVVPWDTLPGVGNTQLPGGIGMVNRPC